MLGLINRQVINPDDFVLRKGSQKAFNDEAEMKANRPVEMKPAVCRAFIAAYEEMMNRSVDYPHLAKKISYRWLILNQVGDSVNTWRIRTRFMNLSPGRIKFVFPRLFRYR